MSPPETRSAAKKRRSEATADGATGSGGFMLFSPPDQVANARREEQERIAKEKDRYDLDLSRQ
jgi:hypothetical protein